MLQEQIITYIRENSVIIAVIAGSIGLLLLINIFVQVAVTRREVHKICKKIRKYFDIVLSEDKQEQTMKGIGEEETLQEYSYEKNMENQQKIQKEDLDAKILLDVIQEVF